uniref:Uncharacterized protein n=1 Tax=Oryza sativa subsp. japonica TaxID=39947 RepID=Q68UR4_ORYSJ|nr:hypothetical protein [Oryza sativa Japonica Group]
MGLGGPSDGSYIFVRGVTGGGIASPYAYPNTNRITAAAGRHRFRRPSFACDDADARHRVAINSRLQFDAVGTPSHASKSTPPASPLADCVATPPPTPSRRQGSCAMCSLLSHHRNPLDHAGDKDVRLDEMACRCNTGLVGNWKDLAGLMG